MPEHLACGAQSKEGEQKIEILYLINVICKNATPPKKDNLSFSKEWRTQTTKEDKHVNKYKSKWSVGNGNLKISK